MPRGQGTKGGGWVWEPRPPGPIALAVQSAAVHISTISATLSVERPYAQPFHTVDAPIPVLKKASYMISDGAAFHVVAFNGEPSADSGTRTHVSH